MALEFEVKLDAFALQNLRKQALCIQAGTVDFPLLKIRRGRLQHFKDGHSLNCGETRAAAFPNQDAESAALSTASPSRSFTPAACSARINSPRSPFITRSKL